MPTSLPCRRRRIGFQGCFVLVEQVRRRRRDSEPSSTSLQPGRSPFGLIEQFLPAQLKRNTMLIIRSWKNMLRHAASFAATSFACLMMLATCGYGQGLAGRWAATGKTMDNGEIQKAILELTVSGNDLKGVESDQAPIPLDLFIAPLGEPA